MRVPFDTPHCNRGKPGLRRSAAVSVYVRQTKWSRRSLAPTSAPPGGPYPPSPCADSANPQSQKWRLEIAMGRESPDPISISPPSRQNPAYGVTYNVPAGSNGMFGTVRCTENCATCEKRKGVGSLPTPFVVLCCSGALKCCPPVFSVPGPNGRRYTIPVQKARPGRRGARENKGDADRLLGDGA
jgi:hypothetical protein